ncbi:MAG: hypothetical protein FWF69_08990 [Firmicutes bacterium]|nr:hypothetical protein [Bacillota bacterium]
MKRAISLTLALLLVWPALALAQETDRIQLAQDIITRLFQGETTVSMNCLRLK